MGAVNCHACRHWLRGTEFNPRSPYGNCLQPDMQDPFENLPPESRWDETCDYAEPKKEAA